jgi:hypothetical protein
MDTSKSQAKALFLQSFALRAELYRLLGILSLAALG